MNQMNMAVMNGGNPAMGAMPMMNNGANGIQPRQAKQHEEIDYTARLNSHVYGYLLHLCQWDVARTFKNSGMKFEPPIVNGDSDVNGIDGTSKIGMDGSKRPDDLPEVSGIKDRQGQPFLLTWYSMFWDVFWAQKKDTERASAAATEFVQLSQAQARQRDQQQQRMMQGMPPGMMAGGMNDYANAMSLRQNMMMGNGDLRQQALQNNRVQMNPQQIAHLRQQQQMKQHQMQQLMQRGGSDMNGQRPRTPGGGEHIPSPSKRQRLDGTPFGGQPIMPNGRPMPPGMGGPQMMQDPSAQHANQLLMNNGINPGNLSDSQFASFQQQNPSVQHKSIQVYAQNMAKNQRDMSKPGGLSDQGSPMMAPDMQLAASGNPDFFPSPATQMQMRNSAMPPNGGPNVAGGNHALQDYQMQLMLLEQQNKKRLLMARQEQDTITRPDQGNMAAQAGNFAPGMSPQGSRGGPSPQPGDSARRGTPKSGQGGMPGSPMPNDARMAGSPAPINFNNMDPALYGQMNGRAMQPPSSNPAFTGPFNPQQMEALAMQRARVASGGMPNGNWQQGPPGQAPMMQPGQMPQPQPMGTPQQRNDMPPPQGVPTNATTNGRQSPAPPTPQTTNKAIPKGKKDAKDRKATKKNSTAGTAATPASEVDVPPATPPPPTPNTPSHPNSFAAAKDGQAQVNPMPNAGVNAAAPMAPPQPDPNAAAQFTNMDGTENENFNPLAYNNDLNDPNLLENFDFEQFLSGDAFNFDAGNFDDPGIEAAGMGDA